MGPGDRVDVVVLRTTFGLLLSRDGGRTFAWTCEEAMLWPDTPPPSFDPAVELSARGPVFAGTEGLRLTPDGCALTRDLTPRGHVFADLARHPASGVLLAVESTPGARNAVWRSAPDAARFERLGDGVDGVLFDTLEVAPSDPRRVYLSGRDTATNRARLYRSDDGGATLARLDATPATIDTAWVSAVHPSDPDTLWVRATVGVGAELWRSRDGGRSFQRLVATPDPMLGFALADDGRRVWIGGVASGLQRSDDGGDTFRAAQRFPVLCLRHHRGVLWACSDGAEGPFALGRSSDDGARFEAALRFEDPRALPGAAACAPPTEASAVCAARWPSLRAELTAASPLDAGAPRDAARDASRDVPLDAPHAPAASPGCGCATSPPRRGAFAWALALAAALSARRRARPRRTPRPPIHPSPPTTGTGRRASSSPR